MSTIHQHPRRWRRVAGLAAVLSLSLVAAACGDDADSSAPESTKAPADTAAAVGSTTTGDSTASSDSAAPADPLTGTVRLGFFPNVTHAPALVGVAEGDFAQHLGDQVDFNTFTFDSGTEASEALLSGSLDLTFIGPNPAINGFAQSNGEAVRIVAGSTSGGAFLVVKPDITSPDQLKGKTLATPSLGNTQDVALRAWLKEQGYETTPDGGGDVTILPQKNSTTLESFINGDIDGAWVPEPWATRLIEEGGGKVLVDERDLWTDTDGQYVTTHLLVRTDFLNDHPDLVKAVIEGLADAVDFIAANPEAAQADVVDQITSITGTAPDAKTIADSWKNLTFTLDPIAASLQGSADDAIAVGLLDPVDLKGIYDLTLLNEVLEARGEPPVEGL